MEVPRALPVGLHGAPNDDPAIPPIQGGWRDHRDHLANLILRQFGLGIFDCF